MSLIKSIIYSVLNKSNYELRNKNKVSNYIEINQSDRKLIELILRNNLSMTSPDRLLATLLAVKYVCNSDIEGDFVECGVWRGGNSIIALNVLNNYGSEKSIWMYDTYKGMTKPTKFDFENASGKYAEEEYNENLEKDYNNWCYASLEDVKKNVKPHRKNIDVKYIVGDILDTLNNDKNIPDRISVLRLDTDWYESTKKELEILYPRLSKGGVILVDDYGHWGGCKKAVDEYFDKSGRKPLFIPSDYTGRIAIKI